MAGTFTHFMACDQAKSKQTDLGDELWQLLNKHYRFLFLGAVSPDLPYLSFQTGGVNWADVMHYENTNSVFKSGYRRLRTSWPSKTAADDTNFVWLMGFLSHLVIDATIHPVVKAIVGPYKEHKEEHRLCEMTEDSIIYYRYRNDDLRYSEFDQVLTFCEESEYFDGLMDFWKDLLMDDYAGKGEEPHPSLWFTTYSDAIGLAQGGSNIAALFRHIGVGTSLIYKTNAEIKNTYPADFDKYFANVNLPTGGTADFEQNVFKKAMVNVIAAWNAVYSGLASGDDVPGFIKNWDLDTGVDMDDPGQTVTYWT